MQWLMVSCNHEHSAWSVERTYRPCSLDCWAQLTEQLYCFSPVVSKVLEFHCRTLLQNSGMLKFYCHLESATWCWVTTLTPVSQCFSQWSCALASPLEVNTCVINSYHVESSSCKVVTQISSICGEGLAMTYGSSLPGDVEKYTSSLGKKNKADEHK